MTNSPPAMPKRKTARPARPDQVQAAVDALRLFWRTGRASWAEVEAATASETTRPAIGAKRRKSLSGFVHGNKVKTLKAAAAKAGVNYDTLAKAWKAAAAYSKDDIEELCGLVEKHRARFGPTHLTRLLAVGDEKRRAALARSAIRGRWGVTALERKIQGAAGRRRPLVGNTPTIPHGEPDLLAALDALCDKWTRWAAAAADAIPKGVMAAVGRANEAVAGVKATVAARQAAIGASE